MGKHHNRQLKSALDWMGSNFWVATAQTHTANDSAQDGSNCIQHIVAS